MVHLRENGVAISGSAQKRKLKNIGYYHGYKGYRFAGRATNRLDISDFNQVVALHAMDMQIKSLLYSRIMSIETALKNYTLEAVLADAKSDSFDVVYKNSLVAYRGYNPGSRDYKKNWIQRIRLRQTVDGLISRNHESKPFFKHFRDKDEDIPIWAIFEALTLGEFGAFYGCLSKGVKTTIVKDLGMPTNVNAESLLLAIIYALKDLRNAIAHNAIVVDVRFKSNQVSSGIGKLLKNEAGIDSVNFTDITDYVMLVLYLMTLLKVPKTERKRFVSEYEAILLKYKKELPAGIYGSLIRTESVVKIRQAREFITKS